MAIYSEGVKLDELVNSLEKIGRGVLDQETKQELSWQEAGLRMVFGKDWSNSPEYVSYQETIGGLPKRYLDHLEDMSNGKIPSWAKVLQRNNIS